MVKFTSKAILFVRYMYVLYFLLLRLVSPDWIRIQTTSQTARSSFIQVNPEIYRDYPRPPRCTRNILPVPNETLTQYTTINRGVRGESVLLYSCNRDVLHRPLCEDSEKTLDGKTSSTYILHLSWKCRLPWVRCHSRRLARPSGWRERPWPAWTRTPPRTKHEKKNICAERRRLFLWHARQQNQDHDEIS